MEESFWVVDQDDLIPVQHRRQHMLQFTLPKIGFVELCFQGSREARSGKPRIKEKVSGSSIERNGVARPVV